MEVRRKEWEKEENEERGRTKRMKAAAILDNQGSNPRLKGIYLRVSSIEKLVLC